MKQGTSFLLPIQIGTDLDNVQKVEFILQQNEKEFSYEYPSDTVIREGNSLAIKFTAEDTWNFEPNVPIYIDTRITLKDSEYQPETEIVKVIMNRTLFKRAQND